MWRAGSRVASHGVALHLEVLLHSQQSCCQIECVFLSHLQTESPGVQSNRFGTSTLLTSPCFQGSPTSRTVREPHSGGGAHPHGAPRKFFWSLWFLEPREGFLAKILEIINNVDEGFLEDPEKRAGRICFGGPNFISALTNQQYLTKSRII